MAGQANQRKYAQYLAEIGWGAEAANLTVAEAEAKHIDPAIICDRNNLPASTHHVQVWIISEPMAFNSMEAGEYGWMCGKRPEGLSYGLRPPNFFAEGDQTSLLESSPHYHNCQEMFVFSGTVPYHHNELGGEIEIWLGLGEQAEKYILTKPTAIVFPAGLVHGPIVFRKVDTPISWVIVHDAPKFSNCVVRLLPPDFKK
jgi:hypothetical protein